MYVISLQCDQLRLHLFQIVSLPPQRALLPRVSQTLDDNILTTFETLFVLLYF